VTPRRLLAAWTARDDFDREAARSIGGGRPPEPVFANASTTLDVIFDEISQEIAVALKTPITPEERVRAWLEFVTGYKFVPGTCRHDGGDRYSGQLDASIHKIVIEGKVSI
jgi:hypothetical protein